jgi:hypothetical protein
MVPPSLGKVIEATPHTHTHLSSFPPYSSHRGRVGDVKLMILRNDAVSELNGLHASAHLPSSKPHEVVIINPIL